MIKCESESGYGYRCNDCVFAKEGRIACANPNIWNEPQTDSYYKSRTSELNDREKESIKLHLED